LPLPLSCTAGQVVTFKYKVVDGSNVDSKNAATVTLSFA
jgi:hypothetical protein